MSVDVTPFNLPLVSERTIKYVTESILSRVHRGNGPFGARCVEAIAGRIGHASIYLVPSGTAALEMGALLADLRPGDEVILPSYTFSSTANAVLLRGAKPVFCEIDPTTLNINPACLADLLSSRTRMIVPVHFAGVPCDMDPIAAFATKHGLTVMEDAAQALGAVYKGRMVGTLGDLAAFSFHETKNFGCGEGGALVVNRPEWNEAASFVQEKGTDRSLFVRGVKSKYCWVGIGSSYLLSDILAATLLPQLESLDAIVARRRAVWTCYSDLLRPRVERGQLQVSTVPEYAISNYHAFFAVFPDPELSERFMQNLRRSGVHAYIGYVPLHSSEFGATLGYRPDDLPLTQRISERMVRFPLFAELDGDMLSRTVSIIDAAMRTLFGN